MNIAKGLFQKTLQRRTASCLLSDIAFVALFMFVAFLLRFEGWIPPRYAGDLWILILVALELQIPVFYLQGLHRNSWSCMSVQELLSRFKGIPYSAPLLGTAPFILKDTSVFVGFPRSIVAIGFFLTLKLFGGLYSSNQIWLQLVTKLPLCGLARIESRDGPVGRRNMWASPAVGLD